MMRTLCGEGKSDAGGCVIARDARHDSVGRWAVLRPPWPSPWPSPSGELLLRSRVCSHEWQVSCCDRGGLVGHQADTKSVLRFSFEAVSSFEQHGT